MVTLTYRALAALALALAVAACGSGSSPRAKTVPTRSAGAPFAWLAPAPPPAGWHSVRVPNGATLSYPPGWRTVKGDGGTATAVLLDRQGHDLGYLNLTPRQNPETLASWTAFRPQHNVEEGERDVSTEGTASGLRLRTGRGACVQDAYTTSTGRRYVEVACLVAGAHASSVVVGAALDTSWGREHAAIERAIDAMTT